MHLLLVYAAGSVYKIYTYVLHNGEQRNTNEKWKVKDDFVHKGVSYSK